MLAKVDRHCFIIDKLGFILHVGSIVIEARISETRGIINWCENCDFLQENYTIFGGFYVWSYYLLEELYNSILDETKICIDGSFLVAYNGQM